MILGRVCSWWLHAAVERVGTGRMGGRGREKSGRAEAVTAG